MSTQRHIRVAIAGGTGLIGRRLAEHLSQRGHQVMVLSRGGGHVAGARTVRWDPSDSAALRPLLAGIDAVVNLAGESIGSGRWTAARKRSILESRLTVTRAIVSALGDGGPQLLVSASAGGYYGPGEEIVDEVSPPGDDFLASVCVQWEAEARRASDRGARCVITRMGVVLAAEGGALPRMLKPVRLGAGGPLGSGNQWMPWVHIDDVAGILELALLGAGSAPTFNVVAPASVRQRDLVKAAGRVLHRPAFIPTPAIALRLLLGEQATVVLDGRPIRPGAALAAGYQHRFTDIEEALRDLLSSPMTARATPP